MDAEVYLKSGRVVRVENLTEVEVNDLSCCIGSQSHFHTVSVGEWVFDGRKIEAIRIIRGVENNGRLRVHKNG